MLSSSSTVVGRQILFRILDPLLLAAAILLAWWVREGSLPRQDAHVPVLVVLACAVVAFSALGVYRALAEVRVIDWCRSAVIALLVVVIGMLGAAFTFKVSEEISRAMVGLGTSFAAVLLVGARILAHQVVLRKFRVGQWVDQVVLVGAPQHVLSFSRHLKRHPELGLKPVAVLSDRRSDAPLGETQSTLLNGSIDDLERVVREKAGNRVIVCGELGDQQAILDVMHRLADTAVVIEYAPDYSAMPIFAFRAGDCAGRPLIDLSNSPWSDGARALKWFEDKLLAALILILVSPLLLAASIAVKLTSPGPIFFRQQRHGMHGRPFAIWKFRTMHQDAPLPPLSDLRLPLPEDEDSDELEVHLPTTQPAFQQTVAGDSRVTAIGRFLRATSIDELPQFWNVLVGDMSIVGPRPHALAHNQQFAKSIGELMRRHHVKPGITGLAQVSGARGRTPNTQAMRDRLRYDIEYIQGWSLWLDISIIVRTVLTQLYTKEP